MDGETIRLSITELRQKSPLNMLKYLLRLKVDRLYLPVEDDNATVLLPILRIISFFVRAREVYIVSPDLQMNETTRWDSFVALLQLSISSLFSLTALIQARRDVAMLERISRQKVNPISGRNVLYLNANLWFGVKAGGSVGHISGVVNALLKQGYAVDFVSAGGRLMVDQRAEYHQLCPATHFGLPWEYNYYRFHFDVVRQLKNIVVKCKPDFIYQRLSLANYSGVALSRLLNIPLVIEYNGSEVWVARNWGRPLRQQLLAEKIEDLNLRHAHLVVTISDVLRDELLARGIPPERIVTYPNCIDPEVFSPVRYSDSQVSELRQRHAIPPDAVVVTFVGTFGQWHGAEVLAKAIVDLIGGKAAWMAEKKLHFLLVGDGAKMPEVRSILGDHAGGSFVTLAGLVPQAEASLYLAASDILVSPHVANADGSKFFGSPTKLFEYMAMGKGIVASNLDQIGEVLSPAINANALPMTAPHSGNAELAVLSEPGNIHQLIDGIQFLVEQHDWRAHIGRNARRCALEKYTWGHHVQAVLDGMDRVGRS